MRRPRRSNLLVPLVAAVCSLSAGQNATSAPAGGSRVAGMVVSKTDGHALAGARVALANTKARQHPISVMTSDDGKFEFTGIPAGKYSLNGAKRGFIAAGYDQHDQYS